MIKFRRFISMMAPVDDGDCGRLPIKLEREVGCVVRFRPVDRRVAGSIPVSNFLANSSGQATI